MCTFETHKKICACLLHSHEAEKYQVLKINERKKGQQTEKEKGNKMKV